MPRLLIIDDEQPVREAIHILGDWERFGVTDIMEASDGKMGLECIQKHNIDIIMVDMNMPELDGISLLKALEKDYPHIIAIVISGYNDFHYTQQAIRSKLVLDYLLKPVNRLELNEALQKAIDLWNAQHQRAHEEIHQNIALNMSLPKLKEKAYLSIIDRSFSTYTNHDLLTLIGAKNPEHRYAAVVLRVLNLDEVKERRFKNDMELLYFSIANIVHELGEDGFQAFCFANPKRECEVIIVYTLQGKSIDELTFHTLLKVKKVVSTLRELFNIVIAAGVGPICEEAKEIAASYNRGLSYLEHIDLLTIKGMLVKSELEIRKPKDTQTLTSRMPMIRAAIEAGNYKHATTILSEFTKQLRTHTYVSLGEADRTRHEFIILLNDLALESGVSSDCLLPSNESSSQGAVISLNYANFDQFEAALHRILAYYIEQIGRSMPSNRPFNVEEIRNYIHHNYFEEIKISMFTEKYYLSREYLMKLFKQQYGYGIHEYVQKVRMEKAKELLNDPNLKILAISEMLGYKDKNYFSKAFRNYYNMSPTEYRAECVK